MDESGKKAFTPHEKNIEDAKAVIRKYYDEAALAVFQIGFKPIQDRTDQDYKEIDTYKRLLVTFTPELMDERFAQGVKDLIQKCNDLLDEPMKGLFAGE